MTNQVIQDINSPLFSNVLLSTTQQSLSINIRQAVGYSVQFVWSGGTNTAGTFIVEATNYNMDETSTIGVFEPISSTEVDTTSGSYLLNVERAMYSYFRVRWVPTGGTTGVLTIIASTKSN